MMSRMSPRHAVSAAVVSLAVAAAAALASCGGSEDEPQAAPTRAAFIAKVDEGCKSSNSRTRALNRELERAAAGARGDKDLLRRLAPVLERAYGPLRDNAAAFHAANPPPADAAEIERIRKLYDEQAELARKLAAAAKQGDVKRYNGLLAEQREVVERSRSRTRAFGFTQCGSSKSDA